MRIALFIPLAAALAATLTGCATPLPPVEVTRFHRIDPAVAVAPGTFAIAPMTAPMQAGEAQVREAPRPLSLSTIDYHAAVGRELERLGYRPVSGESGAQPDYVVSVAVDRSERSPAPRQGSGVSVGVGGSTGSYGSGVGVGVGVDISSLLRGPDRAIIATRLSVRLNRRGEDVALWEGRAESLAREGTPAAQSGLDAGKLATALFAGFPGRSGQTIRVP